MAKKKDKIDKNNVEKDKGGVVLTIILILLIIIILLGGFALFVKFDIGRFGTDVMRPIFKDTPVIKYILPEEEEEYDESESVYKNVQEAEEDIVKLKKEIDKLKKDNADKEDKVEDLTKENKKLKKIEQEQSAFEEKIKEYEKEVVFGDSALDVTEYQKYYEQIDPERAEQLYKQVMLQVESDKKAKELSNTYSKMDPGAAAKALEELDNDIALVCDVLLAMTEKNRAAIMDEMSSEFAAKVTKKIYSDTKNKK